MKPAKAIVNPSHGNMSIDNNQAKNPVPAPTYVVLLAAADTVAAISAAACALCSDTMPPIFGNKKAPEGAIELVLEFYTDDHLVNCQ